MTNQEKINQLEKENKILKAKLVDLKELEEELIADRVFKKAKERLVKWYTFGGIVIFLVSIYGIKSFLDYSKEVVQKKIADISEQQIITIINNESSRQLEPIIKKQGDSLTKKLNDLYLQKREELIISTNPIKGKERERTALASTNKSPSKSVVLKDLSILMNPIRDQGNEGSTIGFSTAAALEYGLKNKYNQDVTLSPRYIYNSVNKGIDAGAYIVDALNLLISKGTVKESVWPYIPGQFAMTPPPQVEASQHFKAKDVKRLEIDTKTFKHYLSRNQVIVSGILVNESFFKSKNGIVNYSEKNKSQGIISICIVGFDENKRLFKFRNSWGTSWGDKGYGYFKYSDVTKFISQAYILDL